MTCIFATGVAQGDQYFATTVSTVMRVTECLTELVSIVLLTEPDWLMYSIHQVEAHSYELKSELQIQARPFQCSLLLTVWSAAAIKVVRCTKSFEIR